MLLIKSIEKPPIEKTVVGAFLIIMLSRRNYQFHNYDPNY